jgi:cell division protease FtsH
MQLPVGKAIERSSALNNNLFQKAAIWLVIALVLFTVFKQFDKPRAQDSVTYSQFMDDAKNGKVSRVDVQGRNLVVSPKEGSSTRSFRRAISGWSAT